MNKVCAICNQLKSFEEFHKNITRSDGRHCYCKHCLKEYRANANWQNHKSQYDKEYNTRSEVAIRRKALRKLWQRSHLDKVRHYRALRRAEVAKCTPKWADLKAIERFYKNCPKGMEVDHIIPIKSKFITGLHVLENLQYLTLKENRQKSNNFNRLT